MRDGWFDTAMGRIGFTLFSDAAPLSVHAFVEAILAGAWDGAAFHRAVRANNDQGSPKIEVIQAAAIEERPHIGHEPTDVTGIRHTAGTISLARAAVGTASGGHVFICAEDAPGLDAGATRAADGLGFAAFGRVTSGMDVVRAIQAGDCIPGEPGSYTAGQVLVEPVRIATARIQR